MEEIKELTSLQLEVQKELGVVVYFYNDDCAPCISLRPKVEQLVNDEFPKMKMLWVNSKDQPTIPINYSVFANPTILLFFDGKETKRFSKYVSVGELENAIDRYYTLIF